MKTNSLTFKNLVTDLNKYKKGALRNEYLLKTYPKASLKLVEFASKWVLAEENNKKEEENETN